MIADLSALGLDAEAIARRTRSIGGSDANIIMSGDEAAVLRLWEQKTGRAEPDDLSGVLPVVMGQWTEPLNAAWFTKQTGIAIVDTGKALADPEWRTATLDGITDGPGGLSVWEAKHVNAFGKPEDTLAKYQPQLHHNMAVARMRRAYLSVFRGNMDWVMFEVAYDLGYGEAVYKAEWSFWMSVLADEPPTPYPAMAPPMPSDYRQVDMSTSNMWCDLAAEYLEHKPAATKFERAKKGLKELVERDVDRAWGAGIEINRDKRGALRFSGSED